MMVNRAVAATTKVEWTRWRGRGGVYRRVFVFPSSFFLLPPRYDGRVNELRQPNTLPAEQHALTDMRVALRDQARGLVTLVGRIHSRSYEVQDTLS